MTSMLLRVCYISFVIVYTFISHIFQTAENHIYAINLVSTRLCNKGNARLKGYFTWSTKSIGTFSCWCSMLISSVKVSYMIEVDAGLWRIHTSYTSMTMQCTMNSPWRIAILLSCFCIIRVVIKNGGYRASKGC